MGCAISCIVQRYGKQIATIISLQTAEKFLTEKVNEVKQAVNSSTEDVENKFDRKIDQERQRVSNIFSKTKNDIGKENLKKVTSLKDQSPAEFLGENKIKNQFNEIENSFRGQLNGKKGEAMQLIEEKEAEFKKEIEAEKPTVPIFSQLSQDNRATVINRVTDKFGSEMKEKQDKYIQPIEQFFNPDKFTQALSSLNQSNSLSSIGDSAESMTSNAKRMAKGSKFLSCF